MAMDEQLLQLNRWSFQLQRGEDLTLIPSDEEPFVVTEVFLVDPQSAAGHGVVSAYVEMGTQKILLAQLSSEVKAVELENPLVLEEEFRVYVMPPGGDADEDTDEDALVVQFKGFMVSLPCYSDTDTDDEEEEEEEGVKRTRVQRMTMTEPTIRTSRVTARSMETWPWRAAT
jgi:hypothetical protein